MRWGGLGWGAKVGMRVGRGVVGVASKVRCVAMAGVDMSMGVRMVVGILRRKRPAACQEPVCARPPRRWCAQ